ncbi:putative fatty acyl-CoA reductase CG5065 isoform X1 [Vanessa atalanta]|uniref:putative fatty acyl-CoA reductase CG5065 isoform X1 n=2 Tax=Vanessa atalanta TaxID=42275 RepID=UPI001FCDAA5F|nr:putative fatty acyl-CoA reductase CG5065 isoform X1 [Vanessa atalanta]
MHGNQSTVIKKSKMVARPKSPVGALLPQFYAGRDIFITGATGFMGKVLIERLLSTCPDVGRLHLLMRSKKGETPEKRLMKLKQSQVFDIIRQQNPSQLDKLSFIQGDVAQPGLGIANDVKQLQEVSVVFHSAATLKFDEPLPSAVEQNVLSVMRLMDICDTLPNLQALVHVSTAYCNPELNVIEEKVYAAPAPLPRLLALVEAVPAPLLASITPQYIKPKPNTYTFTKAMAEEAVRSRVNRSYPIAIFRPTIVVSSLKNPYPGWIENLNGPSGVIAAAGKGLLHVFSRKPGARADLLPVDIAIDTLLAVGWETAVDKLPEVRVYNCSTYENPTTWGEFEAALKMYLTRYPLDGCLWYPSGSGVENRYAQKILEFSLQTVPLHIAEYIMRALGVKMKISLITAEQRLRAMNDVLAFFALREWKFKTDNVEKLRARLTPSDAAIYNLDPRSIDWNDHYKNFVKGTRKYLLKEKDQDIEEARKHANRMYLLHKGVIFFVMILLFRLILQNKTVREIVYGSLRLLLSLLFATYTSVVEA